MTDTPDFDIERSTCILPAKTSVLAYVDDHGRLPYPSAGDDEGIQGSLTVRAPAQAGEVGSSPAPVAIRPYRHSREWSVCLAW
jgi:hypothetical protein